MTLEVVGRHKAFRPAFRFPSPEILFIAPLEEVAKYLVRNQSARALIAELLDEATLRELESPTVLMLRAALDQCEIPTATVSFAELGIPGKLVNMRRRLGPAGAPS
jgi:hypothetical protein